MTTKITHETICGFFAIKESFSEGTYCYNIVIDCSKGSDFILFQVESKWRAYNMPSRDTPKEALLDLINARIDESCSTITKITSELELELAKSNSHKALLEIVSKS